MSELKIMTAVEIRKTDLDVNYIYTNQKFIPIEGEGGVLESKMLKKAMAWEQLTIEVTEQIDKAEVFNEVEGKAPYGLYEWMGNIYNEIDDEEQIKSQLTADKEGE